jgi:hypothetical protein
VLADIKDAEEREYLRGVIDYHVKMQMREALEMKKWRAWGERLRQMVLPLEVKVEAN